MFKVFYTIAARIFFRDPQFICFTVLGLAISFVTSFILWRHTNFELKSDSFQSDAGRIVRAGLIMRWTDDQATWEEVTLGINAPGLAKIIARRHDEIEDGTRIFHQSNFNNELIADHGKQIVLTSAKGSFAETKVIYGDSNLFSFFQIPLLKGTTDSVLDDDNAVVISAGKAVRYFGDDNPIGKTILLNNSIPLKVTGVFKDLPHNTHLNFDIVICAKRLKQRYSDRLEITVGGPHVYYKLKPETDPEEFRQRINTESAELLRKAMYESPNRSLDLFFQPLTEIPFSFHRLDQHNPKSRYFLQVAQSAAWIILIIGLVNYINLMISSHGLRLKELAVKKTSGASFWDFSKQFIFESSMIHGIALVLGIMIIVLIKIPAERILDLYIPGPYDLPFGIWIIIIAVYCSSILITALYPSLIFFKLRTGKLFRLARVYNTDSNIIKVLSIFQYGIAIVMLVLAFAISHQLYYVMNQGQRIRKDNTVIVDLSLATLTPLKMDVLAKKVQQVPSVVAYTYCQSIPGDNSYTLFALRRKLSDLPIVFESNGAVDVNYISFFNLNVVGGENFKEDSAQVNPVILTTGAADRLGFKLPVDALGKTLFSDRNEPMTVIGLVREYKLRPLLRSSDFLYYEGNTGVVLSRLNTRKVVSYPKKLALRFNVPGAGLSEVRKIYESIFPGLPFISSDIDALINSQYHNYQMARNQLIFFLAATLIISLMGLYAMTSLKIVAKTKEIGVRKVLGANGWHITWFLLNRSVQQIGVAACIAFPAAYFILRHYFNDFDEHISIAWYHFAVPLLVFLIISWWPIASIVVKTARENPVEALKDE